jgi:hypothetical protein
LQKIKAHLVWIEARAGSKVLRTLYRLHTAYSAPLR